MSPVRRSLPGHLQKYVVEQDYDRYTPEDQSVWRFVMRQLKSFLSKHAHESYVDGLARTGIDLEKIPHIDVIDAQLGHFGWGAVPVSGFIPPAAFMEFQSLGILPIAADMRSVEHLLYTPAPDIVHEAAGHAPILIDPQFASYLRKYAEVARRAIVSKEDLEQYEAIRRLSDMKEHPDSTPQQIEAAERHLAEVNFRVLEVSEAGWLSRMNWWTAEYGLIGPLTSPKIFGAGLLSSVGESRWCLTSKVKKIPLTVDCIEYGYDITEPQPQLFVTPDFAALHQVLDELSDKMAYRQGGILGLDRAKQARSTNTVVLDSGLQISGVVSEFKPGRAGQIDFIRLTGPVQLSIDDKQLSGHGVDYHSQGYSTPLGPLVGINKDLGQLTEGELSRLGLEIDRNVNLRFVSGIELRGRLISTFRHERKPILYTFSECSVLQGETVLFAPSWGTFDLAAANSVVSVFGGPADRESFGLVDDFSTQRVPKRTIALAQKRKFDLYSQVTQLRIQAFSAERDLPDCKKRWCHLANDFLSTSGGEWLLGVDLYEIGLKLSGPETDHLVMKIRSSLTNATNAPESVQQCITDGLRLCDGLN